MNPISTLLLFILFAFGSIQSTLGLVIPSTIGISSAPSSSVIDSGTPTTTGNRKSVFYFNLTQLSGGTEFNQATLRLLLPRIPQTGSTLSVYKVRGAWNDLVFFYQPQIDFAPLITVPAEQVTETRILELDVTSVIKDWSTAPTGIEGFMVIGTFGESGPNILPLNFDGATSFGLSASLVVDQSTTPQSAENDPFEQWPATLKNRLKNPVFSVQPRILATGSMSGIAHGAGAIIYQWFNNGVPIQSANSASLPLDGLSSGTYTLRATNGFASVTSLPIKFDGANYIPNFSLIPAGTFQMGDNLDGNADAPVHNVYVSQFFMGQTELTYGEWQRVKIWADSHGYQFDNTGAGKGSNYPVTNVDWYDAVKWCNARSEMEGLTPCYYTNQSLDPSFVYRRGRSDISSSMVDWQAEGYRLPTSAEWEKAARGRLVGKRFPNGNTLSPREANYDSTIGSVVEVKTYPPNGYDLFDLSGNVWEFCWNWYGGRDMGTSDPHGPSASDPRFGVTRVMRGGGIYDSAYCSVSFDGGWDPSQTQDIFGFRLVRTSKAPTPRDINSGLIAYYPFNGNANDASGHGFDGTIVGATLGTDRFGNQSGYTFPTTGNKIILPIDHSKFESSFTFSIWVKPEAFTNFYPQIACGQNSFLILAGNGPAYPAGSISKISFYQYIQSSDSYYGNMETANPIPTQTWSHVVITGDQSKRSLYVNGELNQSIPLSSTVQIAQGDRIAIGGHFSINEEQFRWQGSLDDVRIYNRAFTSKDVAALYNSEVPLQITSQPAIYPDGTITVKAQGGDISYQWYKNGHAIVGGTTPSLPISDNTINDGTYTVTIRNSVSSITSLPLTFDAANYIPNFSLIPAGTFQMGDNLDGDPDSPVHNVYVSQFFMAKTELTFGEWQRVKSWAESHGYQFDSQGSGNGTNYPVTNVSWYDSIKWCNAKSEMEGLTPCYYTNLSQSDSSIYRNGSVDITSSMVDWRANGYRLPTSAEWEKAARGGLVGKRYANGDSLAVSEANVANSIGTWTEVAKYPPNGFGLYDMIGNQMEWCWDWAVSAYMSSSTDPRGPDNGQNPPAKVLRGAAWDYDSRYYVSAIGGLVPNDARSDNGFRLARTSKALKPRDITSGLIAYYPFNGNANDASGNSYSLTSVETTLTSDRFGSTNSACNFNGTSSYLFVSGIPIPTNNCFTWALWVRNDDGSLDRPLIERAYAIGNGAMSPHIFTQAGNGDINSLRFGSYDSNYGGDTVSAPSGVFPTKQWTHIATTSDSNGLRCIYINGVLVASGMSSAYGQPLDLFLFGRDRLDGPDRFFAGSLDDIRIYNRALTAKDVATLYNSEAPVQITAQPAVYPDGSLTAKAQGGEISYQWYKNGVPVSGGTSASLPLASGSLSAGTYTLRASNGHSSLTSGSLNYSPTANPNFHDVVPVAGTNVAFSRYETTLGQWKAFVAETGWNTRNSWNEVSYNPSDTQPVVAISREDASDYCQWLSDKTGKTWRLPTADEWRAADQNFVYPWGNYFPPTATDGNFSFFDDGFANSAPVGSFPSNSIGLYDLAGNVWEWTNDTTANGYPIIKGGNFELSTDHHESLYNSFNLGQGGPHVGVGFRVVCELPPDITTGLVAYYPLNGNANDQSGNGRDGIVAGGISSLNCSRMQNRTH
jgi:formylglycine-generating enzyme